MLSKSSVLSIGRDRPSIHGRGRRRDSAVQYEICNVLIPVHLRRSQLHVLLVDASSRLRKLSWGFFVLATGLRPLLIGTWCVHVSQGRCPYATQEVALTVEGGAEAHLARCGHACRCLFEPRPQPRTVNHCNQLHSAPSAATLWVLKRSVLACSLCTTSGGVSVVFALNATCGSYNARSMRPEL
jgi:hypothetical protein